MFIFPKMACRSAFSLWNPVCSCIFAFSEKCLNPCWVRASCLKKEHGKQNKALASLHVETTSPVAGKSLGVLLACLWTVDSTVMFSNQVCTVWCRASPDIFSSRKVMSEVPSLNYLFSFSPFHVSIRSSPTPVARPVNQPHFMTDGCDVALFKSICS